MARATYVSSEGRIVSGETRDGFGAVRAAQVLGCDILDVRLVSYRPDAVDITQAIAAARLDAIEAETRSVHAYRARFAGI